jgi:flagellar biosynthesis/type III secretory pathway protein FliH
MNTSSESRLEYRELAVPVASGPLERLWQSCAEETVFLSSAELGRREREARNTAVVETESKLRHEFETALAAARRELIHSLAAFQSDRAAYFHDMEREVIRLALAVGRTVIERELETDPALLEDAVSDVLQRIENGSKIRLRVPTGDVSAWQASLAMEIDRGIKVEIIGDDVAQPGKCTVETALGSTEFNISERLHEVEAALLATPETTDASRSKPVIVQ